MSDLKSPLYDWHVDQAAKMADFGGWQMPIEYPAGTIAGAPGGVIAEHNAVRERVGLFDVSHLGKIEITGEGALDFVNSIVTNDLIKISDGSAQYNLICNNDGGVIDDLIVYRRGVSDLFLIPNAANCKEVFEVFSAQAPAGITVVNAHKKFGVLALQGPDSAKVAVKLGLSVDFDYMAFSEGLIPGYEPLGSVIVCRTGYTGEFGFEIIPSWEQSQAVWNLLCGLIAQFDGRVCGLGSRDTLRTEMGYPLHGHELSLEISPLQASAGWAVALGKAEFHGRQALVREKEQGVKRFLRGIKSLDRAIPRGEMQVSQNGQTVGVVTSGTFSPTLKSGIGLALISREIKVGEIVQIDVRGRVSDVEVVKAPFVPSHVR